MPPFTSYSFNGYPWCLVHQLGFSDILPVAPPPLIIPLQMKKKVKSLLFIFSNICFRYKI